MSHNILLTGASGYLGGTILARWKDVQLPPHGTLYATVRNQDQSAQVQRYGAEPVIVNISDHDAVAKAIIEREISIIYYLIDAYSATHQVPMLKALGEVRRGTGKDVHFLHTTGAKQFSRHAGVDTARDLADTDPGLCEMQRNVRSGKKFVDQSVRTNPTIIDTAEAHGVRSYIFAPCLVYGRGEGFGNQTSIQDVAIVEAAMKLRKVYKVDTDNPTWPVCHISDTAGLYLHILKKVLQGEEIGSGKNGYYLAASGHAHWNDVYKAMAKALAKRKVIDDDVVTQADDEALAKMGEALGVSPSAVPVLLGGKCRFMPEHGRQIGWTPEYPPSHILETADEEVELILANLDGEKKPIR